MNFDLVAEKVDGIPNMSRRRGRRVYDHLRGTGAAAVLELGTAHAVSTAYMAAAVAERQGSVTTIDHVIATRQRDPAPQDVLARVGLDDHVERVLVEDSSYTWWLKDRIRQATVNGECTPVYDFVYVDGAHNWTIDGFSFFLVEKLLKPGGWVLFDDLAWSYGAERVSFGPGQGPDSLGLSAAERSIPHIAEVYELLVVQHPSFRNFLVEDDDWGWAQKTQDGRRSVERVSTATWRDRIHGALRRA